MMTLNQETDVDEGSQIPRPASDCWRSRRFLIKQAGAGFAGLLSFCDTPVAVWVAMVPAPKQAAQAKTTRIRRSPRWISGLSDRKLRGMSLISHIARACTGSVSPQPVPRTRFSRAA